MTVPTRSRILETASRDQEVVAYGGDLASGAAPSADTEAFAQSAA